MAASPL
ncbi:hypothetical protein ECNE1487_2713, partial [Escherichia coli NE1487]